MICEICGKKSSNLYKIFLDGAILHVCEDCKKYGKEVNPSQKQTVNVKLRKIKVDTSEEEIEEDFYIKLRSYREKNKLTQEDMAKLLGIKFSLYKALEEGKVKPDIDLARKIEKKLGIKIIKKISLFEGGEKKDHKLTVADIIEFLE